MCLPGSVCRLVWGLPADETCLVCLGEIVEEKQSCYCGGDEHRWKRGWQAWNDLGWVHRMVRCSKFFVKMHEHGRSGESFLVFLKEVADASHTSPRRYFPERHIPVVKLLIKKSPAEDSYESNDKPVVISYEGSHSLPGWLQFLSEHTDLNLQEILDGNYQDYVKETCTQTQPRCSCHNWTLASPGSSD